MEDCAPAKSRLYSVVLPATFFGVLLLGQVVCFQSMQAGMQRLERRVEELEKTPAGATHSLLHRVEELEKCSCQRQGNQDEEDEEKVITRELMQGEDSEASGIHASSPPLSADAEQEEKDLQGAVQNIAGRQVFIPHVLFRFYRKDSPLGKYGVLPLFNYIDAHKSFASTLTPEGPQLDSLTVFGCSLPVLPQYREHNATLMSALRFYSEVVTDFARRPHLNMDWKNVTLPNINMDGLKVKVNNHSLNVSEDIPVVLKIVEDYVRYKEGELFEFLECLTGFDLNPDSLTRMYMKNMSASQPSMSSDIFSPVGLPFNLQDDELDIDEARKYAEYLEDALHRETLGDVEDGWHLTAAKAHEVFGGVRLAACFGEEDKVKRMLRSAWATGEKAISRKLSDAALQAALIGCDVLMEGGLKSKFMQKFLEHEFRKAVHSLAQAGTDDIKGAKESMTHSLKEVFERGLADRVNTKRRLSLAKWLLAEGGAGYALRLEGIFKDSLKLAALPLLNDYRALLDSSQSFKGEGLQTVIFIAQRLHYTFSTPVDKTVDMTVKRASELVQIIHDPQFKDVLAWGVLGKALGILNVDMETDASGSNVIECSLPRLLSLFVEDGQTNGLDALLGSMTVEGDDESDQYWQGIGAGEKPPNALGELMKELFGGAVESMLMLGSEFYDFMQKDPRFLDVTESEEGLTLLMRAAKGGRCEGAFEYLLSTKYTNKYYSGKVASLDASDNWGMNAAMHASSSGRSKRYVAIRDVEWSWANTNSQKLQHFIQACKGYLRVALVIVLLVILFFGLGMGAIKKHPEQKLASVYASCRFILKALALFLINYFLRYGGMCQFPVHLWPEILRTESWNFLPIQSYPPVLVALSLIWCAVTCWDFRMAINKSDETSQTATPVSIFQDPAVGLSKCLCTFVLMLLFAYIYISKVSVVINMTIFSRTLWVLSLFIQLHMTTSQSDMRSSVQPNTETPEEPAVVSNLRWLTRLEKINDYNLWAALFHGRQLRVKGETEHVIVVGQLQQTGSEAGTVTLEGQLKASASSPGNGEAVMSKPEAFMRFCMCYLANGALQFIVVFSLPLFLATAEQEVDFVLNAFAATFIVELDDCQSETTYEIHEDAGQEYEHEAVPLNS